MTDSKISFWFVPPEIASLDLSLVEKSILGVVYSFSRNGGECWATDKQFATAFGCGERTVRRELATLITSGYLGKAVIRQANGTTPRRLFLLRTCNQIDGTSLDQGTPYPHPEGTLRPQWPDPTVKMTLPYGQTEGTLRPNWPDPTAKMTGPYGQIGRQIVINKNKDNLSKDNISELPPPHLSKKTEVESEIESGIQESLKTETETEIETESQNPSVKKRRQRTQIPLEDLNLSGVMLESAEAWLAYKRERKEKFTVSSLKALIKKFGDDFPIAVEQSISRGYQGCFLSRDAVTSRKVQIDRLFHELHRTAPNKNEFIPVLKQNRELIRTFGGETEWEAFRIQLAESTPNTPSWYAHRKLFSDRLERMTHAPR